MVLKLPTSVILRSKSLHRVVSQSLSILGETTHPVLWGLWYHVEYPMEEVDIGMSTHAHFDHDALDKIDANMLLDRMSGDI